MRETFIAYFPELMKHEGGYVDHPSDPGGATKYGITIGTLSAWRGAPVTKGDVRQLTKDEAAKIYRKRYWDAIGGDALPAGVDAVALDIAVNHGVGRWRQWSTIIKGMSPEDAVRALCERRRRFYRSLSTFPTFGKGWMRRANTVETWALDWASEHSTGKLSEPKPKTMTTSTEGGAAVVTGATGTSLAIDGVIQAAEQAKRVSDAANGAIDASVPIINIISHLPASAWLGIFIVGAAAFIWWRRRQRLQEHGV